MRLGIELWCDVDCVGECHALTAQNRIRGLYRAVGEDGRDGGIEERQQPLCFAQSIGAEKRICARRRIGRPPRVDLGGDIRLGGPCENGQAKSAFGDEAVTAHGLKRGAKPVGGCFVVARDDPDLPTHLDTHLR